MPKAAPAARRHGDKPRGPHAARNAAGPAATAKRKKAAAKKEHELPTSLSACKKQVRGLTRLLQREGLASTARVELERRLKALTILQTQMSSAQKDRANATRYHGVKFFERKKVLRRLAQVERLLAADEGARELAEERRTLLVDLNYTTYYPNEHKYISLFPADPSATAEDARARREAIREAICLAMEKGELPADPRAVAADDRKVIRKTNKNMMRSVSQVLGPAPAAGEDDADEESAEEEDEFFE
ncbi:18S rRNA maturation protein [Coemansia javaensis]|uniref:rRNA-processing protein EFG1 n=1 Tax=Coemansia javaensis TaxID=2761396 RepID=A0A9W8LF10_9FUNG|nr:18S rRNA maturation protein [Coemansia javaensis]